MLKKISVSILALVAGIIIAIGILDTKLRVTGRLPGQFWIVPRVLPPMVHSIISGTNGIIQITPGDGEVTIRHIGNGQFLVDFDHTKITASIVAARDTTDSASFVPIVRRWQPVSGVRIATENLFVVHIIITEKDARPTVCQVFADKLVTSGTIVRCP